MLEYRTAAAVVGEEDADLKLVGLRLGRWRAGWGFSLQLTVRHLGVFLDDPTDVPVRVLDYLVEELQIRIPALAGRYIARDMTRFEHRWETCEVDG